jgi:hypothetical protein
LGRKGKDIGSLEIEIFGEENEDSDSWVAKLGARRSKDGLGQDVPATVKMYIVGRRGFTAPI